MRLFPLLAAAFVASLIYLTVVERDKLMTFIGTLDDLPEEETVEIASAEAAPAVVTDETAAAPEAEAVSVVALRSEAETVRNAIVLRGTTEAGRRLEVRAETTGLVISDALQKGTSVADGDLLCRLDPGSRPAQLAEARARVEEAQMNENVASRLVERGYTSETQAMSRRAELEA
ncbi:MAG: efflux RND transporter periplasmic adaptor subunit, partial [Pseudomonadota bacterium]